MLVALILLQVKKKQRIQETLCALIGTDYYTNTIFVYIRKQFRGAFNSPRVLPLHSGMYRLHYFGPTNNKRASERNLQFETVMTW